MKKPYRATFSMKYRLWTIWRRTHGWAYPIAINRDLASAWNEAASSAIHGHAFKGKGAAYHG